MLENVGRKVLLIVLLICVSLGLLLLKDKPFELGLDLQGGTRLVYSVNFEQAYTDGTLSRDEDTSQVLDQMIQIIRDRVDPKGVLEPIIRRSGSNRIIIELPGTLGLPTVEAESKLAADLAEVERPYLTLESAEGFPSSGVVQIGDEEIRYEGKQGNQLTGLQHKSGPQPAHAAGTTVVLQGDDAFRAAIESLGELAFRIVAEPGFVPTGTDYEKENSALSKWTTANPGAPLPVFNRLTPEQGGPNPGIEWFPSKEGRNPYPVWRPATEQERFLGGDLARVYPSRDNIGFPAVGFELKASRRSEFRDFTKKYKSRAMAIVLNGEVVSSPRIDEELPGEGIIRGNFSDQDVKDLITVLRSGSLKVKPKLEYDERVGATLGDDYVQRGIWAGLTSLALVVVFMVAYYRKLGVFATGALVANFVLLLGGMSFLNATLTLPGIAGLVLTIGMAVDSNILVFERIREELRRGRNVKQAATNGFDKALSAILDSNITTIIAAVILYKVGTGPVRGFAVTLTVGIVTSLFSALIVTRVLIHYSLVRGTKDFTMGEWMVEAKYRYLAYTKVAVTFSLLLIVGGLVWFGRTPDHEKLGVDFVGGVEAQLRSAQPTDVATFRQRVEAIPGIGESADVKAILNSGTGGKYSLFRVTFKNQPGTNLDEGGDVRSLLQRELAGLLFQDPIQVELQQGGTGPVEVRMLFDRGHPTADVQKQLESVGITNVQVSTTATANEYRATGNVANRDENELKGAIARALQVTDSIGERFNLAQGIASFSQVGPQVVGELRDSAILALAISLFATVLYLRVRFAEYSYGIAAAAAVFHDVLVTLGIVTIANHFGIVNGEISLTMISVFLTIIGYSLNDTIVIFDRVRENLPRMRGSLEEIVEASINQTMSRTILTSLTVFFSVAILYAFNFGTGNVVETFGFAMLVGVITGTYSTVYIANPIMIFWEKRWGRLSGTIGSAMGGREKKAPRSDDDSTALAQV
jgi:SecD/SecF fusion protein